MTSCVLEFRGGGAMLPTGRNAGHITLKRGQIRMEDGDNYFDMSVVDIMMDA
jgi:hypothetical protein